MNAAHAGDPERIEPARVRYLMQVAELAASKARTTRPRFPFRAEDVAAIHTRRDGDPGTWFRLIDGRVFRDTGEPVTTDPAAYGEV